MPLRLPLRLSQHPPQRQRLTIKQGNGVAHSIQRALQMQSQIFNNPNIDNQLTINK